MTITDADRYAAMAAAEHLRDALLMGVFSNAAMQKVQHETARKSFETLRDIFEPEADEPDMDSRRSFVGGYSDGERASIIGAGRGHLLR